MHDNPIIPTRGRAKAAALIASLALTLPYGGPALAQSLTVQPVSITLQPRQLATTVTVINQSNAETSIQVRVVAWQQAGGLEQLTPSDALLISPPIVTIAPGATQVVRLVLRKPAQGKEATYRILLDEIPSAAAVPGTVRIVLSLSLPVFAGPPVRVAPHVTFHVEKSAEHATLVAINDGNSHEMMRDIALTTRTGSIVRIATAGTPYILAGATQQWRLTDEGAALLVAGASLHLTATAVAGAIKRDVPVVVSTSVLLSAQP